MGVEALRETLHAWIVSGDDRYTGAIGLSDVMVKIAELDMEHASIGDLTSWVLVIQGHAKYVSADEMRAVLLHEAIRSDGEIAAMSDDDVRNTLKVFLIKTVRDADHVRGGTSTLHDMSMTALTDKALRMLLRVSRDTAKHHAKQRTLKAQLKAVAKADADALAYATAQQQRVDEEGGATTAAPTAAPDADASPSVARMRKVLVEDGIRTQVSFLYVPLHCTRTLLTVSLAPLTSLTISPRRIRTQAEVDALEDKHVRNTLKVFLIDTVKDASHIHDGTSTLVDLDMEVRARHATVHTRRAGLQALRSC